VTAAVARGSSESLERADRVIQDADEPKSTWLVKSAKYDDCVMTGRSIEGYGVKECKRAPGKTARYLRALKSGATCDAGLLSRWGTVVGNSRKMDDA